jgi:hypothetical protein
VRIIHLGGPVQPPSPMLARNSQTPEMIPAPGSSFLLFNLDFSIDYMRLWRPFSVHIVMVFLQH